MSLLIARAILFVVEAAVGLLVAEGVCIAFGAYEEYDDPPPPPLPLMRVV